MYWVARKWGIVLPVLEVLGEGVFFLCPINLMLTRVCNIIRQHCPTRSGIVCDSVLESNMGKLIDPISHSELSRL